MTATVTSLGPCPQCPQGDLRVTEPEDAFWVGICDQCGYQACAHRSKVDPEQRNRSRLDAAQFPERFTGRPFVEDNENQSAAYQCRAWVRDYTAWRRSTAEGRGAPPMAPALYGRQGRGKSHLVVQTLTWVVEQSDAQVRYWTARGLLRDLQEFDSPSSAAAWRTAVKVDVLALDDLGAERATEWRVDQLADLIDERYAHQLPLLIATNLPPRAWEQEMDVRTVSRVRGMTTPLELPGTDRRQARLELPSTEQTA